MSGKKQNENFLFQKKFQIKAPGSFEILPVMKNIIINRSTDNIQRSLSPGTVPVYNDHKDKMIWITMLQ